MSYYTVRLSANKSTVMPVAGTVILIDDLGGAPGVDIMPSYGGRDLPTMPNRKKAFKFSEAFDAVTLTAPVDCTVALFLSKNDVSLGFADGSLVNVSGQVTVSNAAGAPVPVTIGGGNVQVTATNVGINNTDATAVPVQPKAGSVFTMQRQALANIVDIAPVNVGTAAAALIADATLKRLRVRNGHPTATIAIGGQNVTLANAAILLQPGDIWTEDDAAGAAWYAISNTANATVQLQGIK